MDRRLAPSSGEFDRLFERFRHTAYRLETLQRYTVPYEEKPLRRFLAGEPRPAVLDGKYEWWTQLIADAVAAGKRMQRVHIIVEPLSDYLRFEMAWAYPANIAAGEDVRVIPVQRGQWPDELPGHGYDYWLFDSRQLAVMHYDNEGRFVAVDLVDDPSRVVQANQWRDVALHQATPYAEYKAGD